MGLDNLDQYYYDPNFSGDNHPWGDKQNYEAWKEYHDLLKSGMFWEFYPILGLKISVVSSLFPSL